MADALHFAYSPGRLGRREGAPGLVLQELTQFALASVIARKGQAAQVAAAAQQAFGASLPSTPAIAAGNDLTFVWSGPNHWLALGPQSAEAVEARLGAVFGTHASVFDQSGSRVLLELRGPRVRDVLAKGVSIDLHPRAFRTGDVAVTTASHLAVHLWHGRGRTCLSPAGRTDLVRQPLALARRLRGRVRLRSPGADAVRDAHDLTPPGSSNGTFSLETDAVTSLRARNAWPAVKGSLQCTRKYATVFLPRSATRR